MLKDQYNFLEIIWGHEKSETYPGRKVELAFCKEIDYCEILHWQTDSLPVRHLGSPTKEVVSQIQMSQ